MPEGRGGRVGRMGEGEWEIKAFRNGMNTSWEYNARHREQVSDTVIALHGGRW